MDPEGRMCGKPWAKPPSSSAIDGLKNLSRDNQCLNNFSLQHQKWDNSAYLEYRTRTEEQFPGFSRQSKNPSSVDRSVNNESRVQLVEDNLIGEAPELSNIQEWDPRQMLNNLSFLEQKVHQLRNLVHLIMGRKDQDGSISDEILVQQQHLITADLASIIVQLISTAGNLLPSVKHNLSPVNPYCGSVVPYGAKVNSGGGLPENTVSKVEDHTNDIDHMGNCGNEQACITEEHESKDEDDADEGENLLPGSYEILQLEKEEILAPHTHFCTICGKGFKRDANLRMHMRGHGDEYKTPAALAKPFKESSSEPTLIKRYSCPSVGCKRNKDHKKFLPLKTILCVKNHYKRTHCDKSYTCSRCHTKKFSVVADLKTHEKHCGRDKWLCSCGTTFSRKDKLFGHIALFQGHTPAIPIDEPKASTELVDGGLNSDEGNKVEQPEFIFKSNTPSGSEFQSSRGGKESGADPTNYVVPLNFDPTNLNGFHEFPHVPCENSEGSFSFLLSGSSEYLRKTARYSNPNSLE